MSIDEAAYKECFTFIDTQKSGLISASDFAFALRAMGNAPSESECKELLEANGGSDADGIGLDGLLAAGKKLAGFKPDASELTSALKVLAKDGGKVATGELRKVVNNLESMKIESADLDTVIRVLDPKDDEEVDADALAKALCK